MAQTQPTTVAAIMSPPWTPTPAARGSAVGIYAVAAVAAAASFLTSNPILTAAGVLILLFIGKLLWRPAEPPVLAFAFAYQWAQVTTSVFVADYKGVPVSETSFSPSVETAIALGLVGLVMLGLGMHLGVGRLPRTRQEEMEKQLRSVSVDRVFGLYLCCALYAAVIPHLAWRALSLAQLLLHLASLKWVFYILLGYATLRRRSKVAYFGIASAIEFLSGVGFFADFKTVFFVSALVILSMRMRLNLRMILASTAVLTILVFSGLAWMSIREQYRRFLNQGTGQQVVLVSPAEQVSEFGDLVSDVGATDLHESAAKMLTRIAYVNYFAAAIDFVPKKRPFENGALLWRSLRHLLVPRFIDPDKPVLESDSEITMRYTGLSIASGDRGTSIGMGYMAEAYIDFGPYGMMVLILTFGLLWGTMYAWLVSRSTVTATGLAFGTTLLLNASQFEIAEIKLLGGMIAEFLILALILKYAMPRLHAWLGVQQPVEGGVPSGTRPSGTSSAAALAARMN